MAGMLGKGLSFAHGHREVGRNKSLFNRKSKSDMMIHKMGFRFGKHGKDIPVGKKFKASGKRASIDPSVKGFEKMLKEY